MSTPAEAAHVLRTLFGALRGVVEDMGLPQPACEPGCFRNERPYCHCQACGETGVLLSAADGYCGACESSMKTTEQENAPALCPCGERPAALAGYCGECRADGAGAP